MSFRSSLTIPARKEVICMGRVMNMPFRRVAIYGRVSTEHEAQLSAFENQKEWYAVIAGQHPDWVIVEQYFDLGITGTQAKKRPAFLRMLEDAHNRKFDLIVTREVCRFARNTVDTLTVTRDLKSINVEVYFVNDNIWTMDGDGELRLTIMATLAQEESRKVSERVRAGQQISRNNGVLYGNGNILGYRRVNGTYVIDPEEAFTVQKIFQLYAQGLGYKRICSELVRLGCKNSSGLVEWKQDRIGRILRNATYKGYIGYNKSHSDGYLTQKRVNHRDEEFIYIKGDFSPIVSEELWQKCADLRAKKSTHQRGPDGQMKKFGRKEPQSVWVSKLRCSCGSSFRRFMWHQNADGRKTYGYECYRQKRSVSSAYLKRHGLNASGVCQTKSIPYWHIDMMAVAVFNTVWKERKEAVLLACQMIEECAVLETDSSAAIEMSLEQQIKKLQKKQEGLRGMRAMGDISREEFLSDNQAVQEEIDNLCRQLDDLRSSSEKTSAPQIDMDAIRATLEKWTDFSGPTISDALIEQFILQVVLVDNNTFNWTLDLSGKPNAEGHKHLSPSEIALQLYRDKQHSAIQTDDVPIDTVLSRHITDPQVLFSFTITKEEAAAYCKSIGMKFFAKKWQDKTVIVSI